VGVSKLIVLSTVGVSKLIVLSSVGVSTMLGLAVATKAGDQRHVH